MAAMSRLAVLATLLLAAACGSSDPPPDWPEGSYCVLRAGGCPRAHNGDFVEGTILIDTDDEGADISGAEDSGSSTPGGPDMLARLELCCGDFGPSAVDFPDDSFVLPAGGTVFEPTCPDGFADGKVFIDAEDPEFIGEDADTHLEGQTGGAAITDAGNLDILTCESTPDLAGDLMPEGHYCVFGGDGGSCPHGMAEGIFVTDDEDSGNIDELTGETGGIMQAESTTTFPFCCQ